MTTTQAQLIDGKQAANDLLAQAKRRVLALQERADLTPCLATVLVGEDAGSITYTRMKRTRCESVGMRSVKVELPTETTTEQLVDKITDLSEDPAIHGILLQHPVPAHIDERAGFEAIGADKDVDGVTFASFGHMWLGADQEQGFHSCTPSGIMRLLDQYEVDLEGAHAVVVGRSAILGKPMAGLLLQRNATVTVCHSRTRNLAQTVGGADVVVAAVGKPQFVGGQWIKEGAVVIDAGYNPGNVGDVEFEAAAERASLITPVPGGVGPMTVATLIDQTVTAAARQHGLDHDK